MGAWQGSSVKSANAAAIVLKKFTSAKHKLYSLIVWEMNHIMGDNVHFRGNLNFTIKVALKQHWEDSIRSQLMQNTPDELPSNADTVSRDHDIARNIPVLVLVRLIRIWIIRSCFTEEKQCAICSTQHKSNTRSCDITLSKYFIKTVKILHFYLPVHLPHIWTAWCNSRKKKESQSHADFQINKIIIMLH